MMQAPLLRSCEYNQAALDRVAAMPKVAEQLNGQSWRDV
jgi:hypothetical protein